MGEARRGRRPRGRRRPGARKGDGADFALDTKEKLWTIEVVIS